MLRLILLKKPHSISSFSRVIRSIEAGWPLCVRSNFFDYISALRKTVLDNIYSSLKSLNVSHISSSSFLKGWDGPKL